MHVITYKGKPATLEKLYDAEGDMYSLRDYGENDLYLAAPSRRKAIALYIYHFGFTWVERAKGIDCKKI